MTDLQKLISRKADQTEVAALAVKTRIEIIEATGYKTAPMEWPDLKKGKKLYEQNCTSCHGAQGNGKGQKVKSGDILVALQHPDFIRFQQEYQQAYSQFEYLQKELERQKILRDSLVCRELSK